MFILADFILTVWIQRVWPSYSFAVWGSYCGWESTFVIPNRSMNFTPRYTQMQRVWPSYRITHNMHWALKWKWRKVKRLAAAKNQTQDTSGLSCQCPATKLQQPDNHQPPQSVISLPDPPPPKKKKKKKSSGSGKQGRGCKYLYTIHYENFNNYWTFHHR